MHHITVADRAFDTAAARVSAARRRHNDVTARQATAQHVSAHSLDCCFSA